MPKRVKSRAPIRIASTPPPQATSSARRSAVSRAAPGRLAGVGGSPDYVVQSNLVGAYHCLELARRDGAQFLFMSTSRVYPYGALDALDHREADTRFELAPQDGIPGASEAGIAEDFPLEG